MGLPIGNHWSLRRNPGMLRMRLRARESLVGIGKVAVVGTTSLPTGETLVGVGLIPRKAVIRAWLEAGKALVRIGLISGEGIVGTGPPPGRVLSGRGGRGRAQPGE